MKNDTIIKKLTESFCEDISVTARDLTKPFKNGGYVYFTDGYVGVLVREGILEGDFKDEKMHISLDGLSFISSLSIEEINHLLQAFPKTYEYEEVEVECPECNGRGTVDYEYHSSNEDKYGNKWFTSEVECPICNGEGTITKEKKTGRKIVDDTTCFNIKGTDYLYRTILLMKLQDAMSIFGVEKVSILRIDSLFIAKLKDGVMFVSINRSIELNEIEEDYVCIDLESKKATIKKFKKKTK